MKTFVIVNRPDEQSENLAQYLKEELSKKLEWNEDKPELCFTIGGDGTFIYAVQKYCDQLSDVSFIGIHSGTLGFFTDYLNTEIDDLITDVFNKEGTIVESQLLEVTIDQNEKVYALNEMRVENSSRTQILDIYINDEKLETYRGTGICVCTQLGSTAYNRSVQGAIIQEGLPVIQIAEIAGIHHREFQSLGSPIVLKEDSIVRLVSDNYDGALLCTDSNSRKLDGKAEVVCQLSKRSVRMMRYRRVSYLERLKSLF
ncbi:NAD kinase [Anaerorhabdus sp.]|uniref:NAD kinase n=1 Tax=Anaerorhabdus sp. TaxID=1872524 RepID=UPI002FC744AB